MEILKVPPRLYLSKLLIYILSQQIKLLSVILNLFHVHILISVSKKRRKCKYFFSLCLFQDISPNYHPQAAKQTQLYPRCTVCKQTVRQSHSHWNKMVRESNQTTLSKVRSYSWVKLLSVLTASRDKKQSWLTRNDATKPTTQEREQPYPQITGILRHTHNDKHNFSFTQRTMFSVHPFQATLIWPPDGGHKLWKSDLTLHVVQISLGTIKMWDKHEIKFKELLLTFLFSEPPEHLGEHITVSRCTVSCICDRSVLS